MNDYENQTKKSFLSIKTAAKVQKIRNKIASTIRNSTKSFGIAIQNSNFQKNLFYETKQTKISRQTIILINPKFSIYKKHSQLELNSRALSSQAWGLQQLGIKLNTRAKGSKTTKINRRMIIRKSTKTLFCKKGPSRIRTANLCRLKQLFYLYA